MEEENFDTIVGEDVELTGSIKNTGSILINGTVKGDVESQQAVVIGQNARVEGPVIGNTVQVSGTVDGAINAVDTLEMMPESEVSGDIKAAILNIQPGASFNGTSSMNVDQAEGGKKKDEKSDSKEELKKPSPKLEVEE